MDWLLQVFQKQLEKSLPSPLVFPACPLIVPPIPADKGEGPVSGPRLPTALSILILENQRGEGPVELLNPFLPSPFILSLCCALRELQVLGILGFVEDKRHRGTIPTVTDSPTPRAPS